MPKKSTITIEVELDDNKVPESLHWSAPDGGVEQEESKAILLSLWDDQQKEAMRIDLWTKEMPMDDMKRFFHQVFHTMAESYQRATNEEDVAQEIANFAEVFAQKAGIKM